MNSLQQRRLRQQISLLRRQFVQEGDTPFTGALTSKGIQDLVNLHGLRWRERIFSPLVTLWVFVGQVLSADNSCRAAVARFIAYQVENGRKPCSAATGGYCQARGRLPESFIGDVARKIGSAIEKSVESQWLWKQRRVLMFDGTTVAMPDTKANQAEFPQPSAQKPGLGFPIARLGAVFSLATGAIIELGIASYSGKSQGELSILRRLIDVFRSGDVLLADRLMCSWREMVMLKSRGVDVVTRLAAKRTADFRRGKRLSKDDHIVKWNKPSLRPAEFVDKDLPEHLEVRETRVRVDHAGFRTVSIVLVTTLLDDKEFTKTDLAEIYRSRWSNELDLRALKETMKMDELNCKSPELIRNEIWAHIIAYNLIRSVIAQAANRHEVVPRAISFKGALQSLLGFQPALTKFQSGRAMRQQLIDQLLVVIASHTVGKRPNRFEPRKRKRRCGKYDRLFMPRQEFKTILQRNIKAGN